MSDSSLDRVAAMQYDGLSNQTRLIAYNGSSGNDQNTLYLFEDSVSGNRVTNTIYPDSADTDSSGTDQIEIVYNVDGSLVSRTDQRGTVIAFSYDVLRRQKSQKVTNLGGATDGNIRSITRGYDALGRLVKITSHKDQTDDPDDTSDVENQIVYTFDAFGRMIKSEQSHDGVVSSSPSVQYAYDASQSGSVFNNGYRLQSITYPNGRVLFTDFGSADTLHDRLSSAYRLRETDGSGTILAEYSRMGSGQIVLTDYQQPDLMQDLYQGTSQSYAALDRFGRTVDHRWYKYTSGTVDIARYSHTYDYDGNRLTTEDPVAAAAMVNNDEKNAFDGLNRLTGFERGNLSMGSIASKQFGQDYGLDQLNNWVSFEEDDDGDGMNELSQSRTHNDANEITGIDSSSTHVAHDAAGNMSKVPVPGSWSAHYDLTWDAWNRLVKVQDGVDTVAEYEYDGLNRRVIKSIYTAGSHNHDEHIYLSEGNQLLEVRIDTDPDPRNQFTWGDRYIDDLILRTRDNDLSGSIDETLYAVQDANWDITAVTNASGTVQERFLYDPYGRTVILDDDFTPDGDNTSDVDWDYRFTSREFDAETGLYYFRARYYHVNLGRFVGRDPLEYPDGYSLYPAYFVPSSDDPSGAAGGFPLPIFDPGSLLAGITTFGVIPIPVAVMGGGFFLRFDVQLKVGCCVCPNGQVGSYSYIRGGFEIGIYSGFMGPSLHVAIPYAENLKSCPKTGAQWSWAFTVRLVVFAVVASCTYTNTSRDWKCTSSIRLTRFFSPNALNIQVSGGGRYVVTDRRC